MLIRIEYFHTRTVTVTLNRIEQNNGCKNVTASEKRVSKRNFFFSPCRYCLILTFFFRFFCLVTIGVVGQYCSSWAKRNLIKGSLLGKYLLQFPRPSVSRYTLTSLSLQLPSLQILGTLMPRIYLNNVKWCKLYTQNLSTYSKIRYSVVIFSLSTFVRMFMSAFHQIAGIGHMIVFEKAT